MSVATDAILRVVVSLTFPESVIAQNVFYTLFKNTGASDAEADVLSDLVDWVEGIYANMNTYIDADVALSHLITYFWDATGQDWDEVGLDTLSDAFAGAVDMLPHGAAAVLHAKTTNPDRSGSKFFGGLSEGAQNQSILVTPFITALGLTGADWISGFVGSATGSDFDPGIFSGTDLVFYEFSNVVDVAGYIGYQRRRKPGVGS